MAYDQGYYQPPQRPYNGRAAQRPGPPQGYDQAPPPQQQYSQQQYDQYPQDGYGYDSYDNGGYAQQQDAYYENMNGGGRGNRYPPQNQGYAPQQEYYDDAGRGAMPPPRGGGRGGPMQRPPTADGARGGYGQRGAGGGRGYPDGGPVGRGGRPGPLERSATSDPMSRGQGQQQVRKPLKTPPLSPDVPAWDNPFPTFPGAKKKTSVSEEQHILQKMAAMEVEGPPQGRGKGGKGSQGYPRGVPTDDFGRPSLDGQRRPPEEYGRGSVDSQRPPRNYAPQGAPQQGYPDQRRGPPGPNGGYGAPRQIGYSEPGFNDRGAYPGPASPARENFGPPGRSMTMPNEVPMSMGRPPPMPAPMEAGPSAPYNGPVGRGMPPRPSTSSGYRQAPQRQYTNQAPPMDPYANGNRGPPANQNQGYGHRQDESVSDFYDSYYDAPDPQQQQQMTPQSAESELPDFDALANKPATGRRGDSIDEHIRPPIPQNTGYQQVKPVQAHPDARGRIEPQAAVFEMAGDAPPMPNAYPLSQNYPNDSYDNQYNQGQGGQGYRSYEEPLPPPNTFVPPPRSASAAPEGRRGLPNGPKAGFQGLPNGPSPGNMARNNTMPRQSPSDALPSHPPPVRAGLIPNTVANQAMNRPPPVRNYNNITPVQQPPPVQQVQQPPTQQMPAPQPKSAASAAPAPLPVTAEEIERLRTMVKANPNGDQETQMVFIKKLVEAADVLAPLIQDPRARNKAREKYVMDAHKLLKKLVAAQHTDAMFYLADCYGRGALGLETDNKEAFTLYQSAAKGGHAAAAYRTAVCCELGNDEGGGTRKDPLKAIQWYKRAATLGDIPAMYKMGMIQLKGLLGQQRNPREAVGWLKRAAERADAENPHAVHELALLYEQPQSADNSVVRDEGYSFKLFMQAADLGYKFSQFRLGAAFEYGLFNCPIDPRQSIMWYSRAAAQEEHQSELALSGWYLTGSEGVLQQSDTEAYLWARKAAMAGLAKAEYAMGYFTEVGIGAPANLEDAKRWYWRAAAQNFPKARERLEDLKRGGAKAGPKRERISRSKVGKQNEGECSVM
ncbi:hypothetical protein BDZ45DRAFT_737234 [Acephala macrosclerotiorum]|nr:hypothetical protein BDZ45DRAFT_737234 [Acephala macrosclerotiorum]